VSTIPLVPGAQILLSLMLANGDADKFVRATLQKFDGTVLFDSPYTLNHVGNGRYTYSNSILVFPVNEPSVYAIYEIFNDEDFTEEAIEYTQGIDEFVLSNATGVGGSGIESSGILIGIVEETSITGIVEKQE